MRILVVDDSAFMRKAISQMITSDPSLEVVGTARNGIEAVELAKTLLPDLITLDIEMPEMDGITALRQIMREAPTQVLMFSSLSSDGSNAAIRALTHGAADVLAKDTSQGPLGIKDMRDDLIQRIHALCSARLKPAVLPQATQATSAPLPAFKPGQFDVICIGSSTGGPPVLETLLTGLPATFRTPILIAQHMPRSFTESLAQRIDQCSSLHVEHAHDGQPVEPGCAYIAPGGQHMHLHKVGLAQWVLHINDEPGDAPYKPSVNALFNSAAVTTGRRTLAMVLTGIGDDGLKGARALHDKGAILLAQDEQSSVVYGMPKAVTNDNLVSANLTPEQMNQALCQLASA